MSVKTQLVHPSKKNSEMAAPRASQNASVMIGSKPSLISVSPMKFLIMDAPRQSNLHLYIKEMRNHGVIEVVRVCEPTYLPGELNSAGIGLHDMAYEDGHSPPKNLIEDWLSLVDQTFYSPGKSENAAIAVHCIAGLGRAPVMVAIALIEFANMDPVEAVTLIRRQRRGAINEKQLIYLEGYRKQYKKKNAGGGESSCCIIL
mmetsp:Transcript_12512/g.17762  ORF Transcript_12512/g.17762 Transcript_12512/m.17762 type:complete len:202 (-) Transcript_12512:194-799(-)